MWGIFLNFLSGGVIKQIGNQLNKALQARLNAKNETERIEADQNIAVIAAQRAILVAEQGSWMTRPIRPLFALPFIIYNFKVLVWDKVLGWGVTDPLSEHFMYLEIAIFSAYFVTRAWEKYKK